MKHPPTRWMTRLFIAAAVFSLVSWGGDHASRAAPAPAKPATRPPEVYSAWPFDAKEAARRQVATAAALGVPKEVSLDLGKRVMLKLVLVPAGKFAMGSPESEKGRQGNERRHDVTLTKPYYMGVYKVTQAQYQQVMGNNPSTYKGPNFPVAAVSWEEATEFCKRVSDLTHRKVALPTEAQWEFMCRAGTATAFVFGDDESRIGDYAWGVSTGAGRCTPSARRSPTPSASTTCTA